MILKIRNMVCRHCVEAPKRTLLDQGLHPLSVELGVAEIEDENLGEALLRCLDNALEAQGFSGIKSHDEEIAEKKKREEERRRKEEERRKREEEKKKKKPSIFAKWTKTIENKLGSTCDNILNMMDDDESNEQ